MDQNFLLIKLFAHDAKKTKKQKQTNKQTTQNKTTT